MPQDFTPIARIAPPPRVALLIDGDNISHDLAARILTLAQQQGETILHRVYGNAALRPGWLAVPGVSFRHAGSGKNAADLLLTVEAMELMLSRAADVLVVASSDGDFSHLAQRLRELGHPVIGLGQAKAPESFRLACRSFVTLDPPIATPPRPLTGLEALVLAELKGRKGGLPLVELASRLHAGQKIHISDQPEKTWRAWFQARPALFDCDPKGPQARVRLAAPS